MKKKVMLLMMFIPLVFMLTVYSVTKVVSIIVDIPVSGIAITTQNDDGFIALDMATYNNDLYITAEVYPQTANNKKYTIDVTGVGDEPAAEITVDSVTGQLKTYGVGRAKITVTSNENAYSDSVIVSVNSSKLLDFAPYLYYANDAAVNLVPSNDAAFDYTANVVSGALRFDANVSPTALSASGIVWTSSDENVVKISSVTGKAQAMLSGDTVITATADNGINGNIVKKIKLTVTPQQTNSGVTVNGSVGTSVLCDKNGNTVSFLAEVLNDGVLKILCDDMIGDPQFTNLGNGKYSVVLTLAEGHAAEVVIKLTSASEYNEITAVFSDFSVQVYTGYHTTDDNQMYMKDGAAVTFFADPTPYDGAITYVWSCSDDTVLGITENSATAKITALKVGEATLTVSAYKGEKLLGDVTKTVTVVKPVIGLEFAETAKSYGIGNVLAIGNFVIENGNYQLSNPALGLKVRNADGTYTSYGWQVFGDNVVITSSNSEVAMPSPSLTQLKAALVSSGKVTFTAQWKYASYFKETVSASVTVNSVKDGVSVNNYSDLVKATEDGKQVVLNSNVMLGKKDATLSELQSYVKYMPTTYDWQFYDNQGVSRPNVMYLIEFKNNVFGNGYEINGDYITKATDSTGNPLLYKGPIDFVSISVAAVKGQDNICFLVRTDGVVLDNVVLKGCSDESLFDNDGNYNLSELNYVGTTLEIGSTATVKNCRVSNGRTVARIFGGGETNGKPVVGKPSEINAASERISVVIESSILTSAREFIVKTGSNRALMSTGDTEADFALQKLTKADGSAYNPENGGAVNDKYFYDNYVTTDLTIKNSVLYTSGLFSIGVETHFAGSMLAGYGFSPQYWSKLAATSYAVALKLEGNVQLLDWKKLENVDSSTLIETYGNLGENKQFLQLDISAMLNKVSKNQNYGNVISVRDGQKYVHGGIAFYGGGYNYSYLDASKLTSEKLPAYTVNLNVLAEGEDEKSALYLQGTMLPLAAGPASFRFFMYDNLSETNYENQMNAVDSGVAFKVSPAE